MAIAQEHEAARSDIVALLTSFLDRPEADASADEEEITSSVICDLGDLGDASAYDAIRRAFEEDRVTPHIVGLSDIEQDFGMRPPSDLSLPLVPRPEPGVRLSLRCKACGRARARVSNGLPRYTHARQPKEAREVRPVGYPGNASSAPSAAPSISMSWGPWDIAITASMMAEVAPEGRSILRAKISESGPSQLAGDRCIPMRPSSATSENWRAGPTMSRCASAWATRSACWVNWTRPKSSSSTHSSLDAQNLEAWEVLAQLAGERKDIPEAIRCWQQVLELAPGRAIRGRRQELIEQVTKNLAELDKGIIPEYTASTGSRERGPQGTATAAGTQPRRRVARSCQRQKWDVTSAVRVEAEKSTALPDGQKA